MAMLLEQAGITSLNVSLGVYESWFMQVPPSVMGHGWLTKYSSEIKKVVDIPVTTVGRINNPLVAEAIIKSGKADACYMGRASLADPHMPNKAMAGQWEDIIRCASLVFRGLLAGSDRCSTCKARRMHTQPSYCNGR